jgi:hypothetical protein
MPQVAHVLTLHHGQFQTAFLTLGGVIDLWFNQSAHFYANAATEEAWFDLHPGFTREHVATLDRVAARLGYTPVTDDLEAVEFFDDGTIRQWLCQESYPEQDTKEMELIAAS